VMGGTWDQEAQNRNMDIEGADVITKDALRSEVRECGGFISFFAEDIGVAMEGER